jgi:multidrug transporter EmrE-like cation transporter
MTTRGLVFVVIAACMMASASLMLRAGIQRAGGFGSSGGQILNDIWNLARQPIFDLGVILYGLGTLVWMRVIASEPLSLGYPMLTSIAFVVITGGAALFFHEALSVIKVVGMVIILVGIFVLANG